MYTAPKLIEYGSATEQIQGTCNWGTENIWLDAYGWYKYSYNHCTAPMVCTFDVICAQTDPPSECKVNEDCGPKPIETK